MQPETIAQCCLDHYERQLTKGKPKPKGEWTVFAAILAERLHPGDSWVVSCATGTKCTAFRHSGCVLHDCHAEVLARRGLMRTLWTEILSSSTPSTLPSGNRWLLVPSEKDDGKFCLSSNVKLHLYISCSPCGDATIYPVTENDVMLHTGAKVIVSPESGIDPSHCGGEGRLLQGTTVAREEIQVLGKLRTKSGRSNLPAHLRSSSMSCSDKIVQWCLMGLEGGLLSGKIDSPIFLSSIVVSQDPRVEAGSTSLPSTQQQALQRAIPDRVVAVWDVVRKAESPPRWQVTVPSVHVVPIEFPADKATMEAEILATSSSNIKHQGQSNGTTCYHSVSKKRKRNEEGPGGLSPCGISLNWLHLDATTTELIVGARGICQGKKPKADSDYTKLASRLCRRELVRLAQRAYVPSTNSSIAYQTFKNQVACPEWKHWKNAILKSPTLAGWLRTSEEADFSFVL